MKIPFLSISALSLIFSANMRPMDKQKIDEKEIRDDDNTMQLKKHVELLGQEAGHSLHIWMMEMYPQNPGDTKTIFVSDEKSAFNNSFVTALRNGFADALDNMDISNPYNQVAADKFICICVEFLKFKELIPVSLEKLLQTTRTLPKKYDLKPAWQPFEIIHKIGFEIIREGLVAKKSEEGAIEESFIAKLLRKCKERIIDPVKEIIFDSKNVTNQETDKAALYEKICKIIQALLELGERPSKKFLDLVEVDQRIRNMVINYMGHTLFLETGDEDLFTKLCVIFLEKEDLTPKILEGRLEYAANAELVAIKQSKTFDALTIAYKQGMEKFRTYIEDDNYLSYTNMGLEFRRNTVSYQKNLSAEHLSFDSLANSPATLEKSELTDFVQRVRELIQQLLETENILKSNEENLDQEDIQKKLGSEIKNQLKPKLEEVGVLLDKVFAPQTPNEASLPIKRACLVALIELEKRIKESITLMESVVAGDTSAAPEKSDFEDLLEQLNTVLDKTKKPTKTLLMDQPLTLRLLNTIQIPYEKMHIMIKILMKAGHVPSNEFLEEVILKFDLNTLKIVEAQFSGTRNKPKYKSTMLHHALRNIEPTPTGLYMIQRLLLLDPFFAKALDSKGNSPLHILGRCKFSQPELTFKRLVAEELLRKRVYVDVANTDLETPLLVACAEFKAESDKNGFKQFVELLLGNGASPAKVVSKDGKSVFLAILADQERAAEIVELMLNNTDLANCMEQTDRCGNNLWHLLAKRSDDKSLTKILDVITKSFKSKIKLSTLLSKNCEKKTPLHIAAEKNNRSLFKYIFEMYLNCNLERLAEMDFYGDNVFHTACKNESTNIVRITLDLFHEGRITYGQRSSLYSSVITKLGLLWTGPVTWFLGLKNEEGKTAIDLAEGETKDILLVFKKSSA